MSVLTWESLMVACNLRNCNNGIMVLLKALCKTAHHKDATILILIIIIINQKFNTGIFPDSLKVAEVKPLFKKINAQSATPGFPTIPLYYAKDQCEALPEAKLDMGCCRVLMTFNLTGDVEGSDTSF